MKAPMKGAAIGHAKQRRSGSRYVGLTEPGIIAAEPPNPIVNHLVVLPDIEKRLEAFLRIGHGIIVFPGGAGTAEEILYLLGVLSDPANAEQCLPVLFTGPESSREYFEEIDRFVTSTLGEAVRERYRIIIGDARRAARFMARRMSKVRSNRRKTGDAYYFNWLLRIPEDYQLPFVVSHESVAALRLDPDLPTGELSANLRKAFSAIVTGNVKDHGIRMIRQHGPFEIRGDNEIVRRLGDLLTSFARQGRMKIAMDSYEPCYRVVAP
jgi:predicted Rossmann-fold nucleotide-binding protein